MQALDSIGIFKEACKGAAKWGVYISIFVGDVSISKDDGELNDEIDEVLTALPFLNLRDHIQIILDNQGWFLFDTREEMETVYWQCIGDDGPNENNPYTGPVNVYALTCDPTGQSLNENT